MMTQHSHQFVERYTGLVGFGLDRETDENTLICYLQKFSDDAVMAAIIRRLADHELAEVFDLINRLLRRHFTEAEYHRLFLKDEDHGDGH
jgi:TorA maturation chaperone TorD